MVPVRARLMGPPIEFTVVARILQLVGHAFGAPIGVTLSARIVNRRQYSYFRSQALACMSCTQKPPSLRAGHVGSRILLVGLNHSIKDFFAIFEIQDLADLIDWLSHKKLTDNVYKNAYWTKLQSTIVYNHIAAGTKTSNEPDAIKFVTLQSDANT